MDAETIPWHSCAISEAIEALGTDPSAGLTADEAKTRLGKCGRNELAERPRPGFCNDC